MVKDPNMSFRLLRLIALGAAATIAASGETNRSWDVLVESIETGKKVVVTRMSSGKVEGKLLGISADSITVEWRGKPTEVRREDVFRVRYADIRMRNTFLGLAIGFGGGAIIGATSVDNRKGLTALAGGLFGMGIGAGTGGALPIGAPLYQVERRTARNAP